MPDVVDVIDVETHADHIDALITDHIDAARPVRAATTGHHIDAMITNSIDGARPVRAATTGQDQADDRVVPRLNDPDQEYVLYPAQL